MALSHSHTEILCKGLAHSSCKLHILTAHYGVLVLKHLFQESPLTGSQMLQILFVARVQNAANLLAIAPQHQLPHSQRGSLCLQSCGRQLYLDLLTSLLWQR